MQLPNNSPRLVYENYTKNFTLLPKYEQFHLISRLFLVKNDPWAGQQIQVLADKLRAVPKQAAWDILQEYLTNIAPINNQIERAQYLAKYPDIRPIARYLFTIFFGKKLFNLDFSSFFTFSKTEVAHLQDELLKDEAAVKELTAFTINFILLSTHYFAKNADSTITIDLYELSKRLYTPDKSAGELESWIYYLTHLIIGDSLFYVVPLSQQKEKLYTEILQAIESKVSQNYMWVHLDCKLEFLVCCQLHSYHSYLEPIIHSEANCSLSKNGNFVVDTHNLHPQLHRVEFATSEHRNALYLISTYTSSIKNS